MITTKEDAGFVIQLLEQMQLDLIDKADKETNDFKRNVINSKIGDLNMAIKVINKEFIESKMCLEST